MRAVLFVLTTARARSRTSSFGWNLLYRTELQRLYTAADLCDIAHDYNGQLVRLHILPGNRCTSAEVTRMIFGMYVR